MCSIPRRYPIQLFLAIATTMLLVEWFIVHSLAFTRQPNSLALCVTADFVLVLPLAYYWLIVRTGRWSKTSLVAVYGASLGLAKWLLPVENQPYVNDLVGTLPLLEVGVLAYIGWHGVAVFKAYRAYQQHSPNFIQNLQQSLTDVTNQPKLSQILATEAAILRYGLFGWLGKTEVGPLLRAITSHRDSGQVALLAMLALVAVIESVAVHLLVARWSVLGAWILTATSVYGLLFIIAEIVTTIKRPSYLTGETLHLLFGMRWQGTVELSNIERVERINEKPGKAPDLLTGPLLVQPNLLLTLREPVLFTGIYGLKKTVTQVTMLVDSTNLQGLQDLTGFKLTQCLPSNS